MPTPPRDPNVTPDMRDPETPASVHVRASPRPPFTDPKMGVELPRPVDRSMHPRNRLVAVGDSLTHGFQSGTILNTDLSYPATIAWEMGWCPHFRFPRYRGFGGVGPVPNLEYLLRNLEHHVGGDVTALSWWEYGRAAFAIRDLMDKVEDYWERGPGSQVPVETAIKHNLGVYAWDVRDVLDRTADTYFSTRQTPRDSYLDQLVENANGLASAYVLNSARQPGTGTALTPVQAAQALGAEGSTEQPGQGDGIETLIVMVGANNVLGTVVRLKVEWSRRPGPPLNASLQARMEYLKEKQEWTVWDPDHFKAELDLLVREVKKVRARHVIWAGVPHVTIAPIARGLGDKVVRSAPGSSRYFPIYARPWVTKETFNSKDDACITHQQARAIDSAIDQYNDTIAAAVKAARRQGRDWYFLDLAYMLDRLAARRYASDPGAQPSWWTPYELPEALRRLPVEPTTRFFESGPGGRIEGGLFSLDGVHPTTIGYGLVAQEVIDVMRLAGVQFFWGDGKTERHGPIRVDFDRLLKLDSLMSAPPRNLASALSLLRWLDERTDFIQRLFNKKV